MYGERERAIMKEKEDEEVEKCV